MYVVYPDCMMLPDNQLKMGIRRCTYEAHNALRLYLHKGGVQSLIYTER